MFAEFPGELKKKKNSVAQKMFSRFICAFIGLPLQQSFIFNLFWGIRMCNTGLQYVCSVTTAPEITVLGVLDVWWPMGTELLSSHIV